jgi:hypothetical protein
MHRPLALEDGIVFDANELQRWRQCDSCHRVLYSTKTRIVMPSGATAYVATLAVVLGAL